MEACTYFQQRTHPAIDVGVSLGWVRNARQDPEQSALANAVAADNANDFTRVDLEANIFEGPNCFV